jgi:hypothetical protein
MRPSLKQFPEVFSQVDLDESNSEAALHALLKRTGHPLIE